METLRNKYDLAIAEPITLDQMKLIYYPMTTGRNETGHWMCDMIPAWQFRFIEDEIEQYVYINALDGREIVGVSLIQIMDKNRNRRNYEKNV